MTSGYDVEKDLRNFTTRGVSSYLDYLDKFDELINLAAEYGFDKERREQIGLMLKIVNDRVRVHRDGLTQEVIPQLQATLDVIREIVEGKLPKEERAAVMADIKKRLKESKLILLASTPASSGQS